MGISLGIKSNEKWIRKRVRTHEEFACAFGPRIITKKATKKRTQERKKNMKVNKTETFPA